MTAPETSLAARLDQAVGAIHAATPLRPTKGVVLGSGLGAFADTLADACRIPFASIPHFPSPTVEGHAGALILGRCHGVPVAVLQGRVHFYEGHPLPEVVFPVRVLARLGVTSLVLTNAAGGVDPTYQPGDLMIVEDHINLIGNPLVGPNEGSLGPRFPDLTDAYDPELRRRAAAVCSAAGVRWHCGVYLAMSGPSYETPAEIRMARVLGADAVGMSTAPEVIAARHAGMRVLALSCITNPAAGVAGSPLDHRDVLSAAERARPSLIEVLTRIVSALAEP